MKLSLTFPTRLALLAMLLILGLILAGGLALLLGKVSANAVAVARIAVVAQDLIAFIIPSVVLALLVTRLPAEFLMIKRFPRPRLLGLAILTLIAAFPAIEFINSLCEQLPWPASVLEAENAVAAQTATVLGPHDVPNLLVSILIVGVLTGLAEELFFRGALQQVLRTRPMSIHLAVWLAAILFSLMHGQMVGFIPRALLGAFLGYATVWTGSLWTAAICHALNNTAAILTLWTGLNLTSAPAIGIISMLLAASGIYVLSKSRSNN